MSQTVKNKTKQRTTEWDTEINNNDPVRYDVEMAAAMMDFDIILSGELGSYPWCLSLYHHLLWQYCKGGSRKHR